MHRLRTALPSILVLAMLARVGLARAEEPAPPAATPEARAEAERLSDEIEKLSKRQAWSGVEKKFRELTALGLPIAQQDYLYGAYAARELGDVGAAYDRLQNAARLGGTKEIVDWLWDIDHNYGNVDLLMVPPRSVELTCAEMPMDPNQRKAVEAAMRATEDDGAYSGLLPQGSYTFAGQAFQVQPGVSVRIEFNPKTRKHGPAEPVIRYPQAPPVQGGTTTSSTGSSSTGAPPSDAGSSTLDPEAPQPAEPQPQE